MVRVVVTGLGCVSPLASNLEDTWKGLLEGRSGIARISNFDPSKLGSQIAGEVLDFDPAKFVEPREVSRMDRFVQFALASSQMAVDDSGLDLDAIDLTRAGAFFGSGIGGLSTLETQKEIMMNKGPRRVSPLLIPMMIVNMAAGYISMRFGLRGPNSCAVTACATGTHCIGDAFKVIQRGHADLMVAGGTEAAITPLGVAGFSNMKALSTRNDDPEHASRPFDRDRDGFIMGEGSGAVVLESLEHAQKRGARIYAEICGYGMSADAHHITAPAPEGIGAQQAMREALQDGGIDHDEVDYINAHGTSTELNDKFETFAIRQVFGDHADHGLVVSSTKSMVGHLLGAAGGVEAVFTTKAVYHGAIPPTMNLENPGEGCDLDYCPNEAREKEIRIALSNSFGFGGQNAVIVLKKF